MKKQSDALDFETADAAVAGLRALAGSLRKAAGDFKRLGDRVLAARYLEHAQTYERKAKERAGALETRRDAAAEADPDGRGRRRRT